MLQFLAPLLYTLSCVCPDIIRPYRASASGNQISVIFYLWVLVPSSQMTERYPLRAKLVGLSLPEPPRAHRQFLISFWGLLTVLVFRTPSTSRNTTKFLCFCPFVFSFPRFSVAEQIKSIRPFLPGCCFYCFNYLAFYYHSLQSLSYTAFFCVR